MPATTLLELPDEIDLRAVSDQRQYTTDAKGRHLYGVFERTRTRDWSQITGIVLHQTACLMGERPARYLNMGAHWGVTRGGLRLRLHELTDRIVSANRFNARCVSVEIDGRYAGDETSPARKLATTWDDKSTQVRELPMDLTPEAEAAALWVCESIVDEVAANGGQVKFFFAHRQSSGTRQSDPGEQPWRRVALPFIAKHKLNLQAPTFLDRTFKVDDGRVIPERWDPSFKGNRY